MINETFKIQKEHKIWSFCNKMSTQYAQKPVTFEKEQSWSFAESVCRHLTGWREDRELKLFLIVCFK